MQQWWLDDGFGLKSVIYAVFYDFPLIFKVFINIHKYANEVIGSSGDEMKGTCLIFNLVVYDNYQLLRYD